MGLWENLANLFFGGGEEPPDEPTDEDYEAARAADRIMGRDYGEDWSAGIEMGTVPNTPGEYEGQDTDPDQEAFRPDPWYRKFFPW